MVLRDIRSSLVPLGSHDVGVAFNLNVGPWRELRRLGSDEPWLVADIEFICRFIEKADGKGDTLKSIDHGDCKMTRGYAYTVIIAKPKPGVGTEQFTDWVQNQAMQAIRVLNDQ